LTNLIYSLNFQNVMKKLLLLAIAICFTLVVFAQERIPLSKNLKKQSAVYQYPDLREPLTPLVSQNNSVPQVMKSDLLIGDEVEIIDTYYDLQTNNMLGNRFYVWEDGTMAGVTTRGMNSSNWSDRGTGYNYFDGSDWGDKPTQRIENVATGWPTIAPWGPSGEIIAAHTMNFPFILTLNKRENKGTGTWTSIDYPGPGGVVEPTWPRIVTSGTNNEIIHMFYGTWNLYEGLDNAALYSRSEDGGQTWFPQDYILPGMAADDYFTIQGDAWVLSSKNNVVALLHCSKWADMFIMKTTDHGENWEKIMIWEHPYPFFNVESSVTEDTLYTSDASASLAIDDNGMIHVVFGLTRVERTSENAPGGYFLYPYVDGIGYWNESMGQITEADDYHYTMNPDRLLDMGMLVGWTQDMDGDGEINFEGTNTPFPFISYRSTGLSTMPTIAINGSMIAMAYSSVTEGELTPLDEYNYRRIFTRFSYDLGLTWGDFNYLQEDELFHLIDECIYPVLAENANPDGVFQLIYNADERPGLFLDEDQTEPTLNRIVHNSMTFTVGINQPLQTNINTLTVSQSYPNPTNDVTDIIVELAIPSAVGVEVFNMTGQKVLEVMAKSLNAGSHNLRFDASSLNSGVYFYSVSNGSESVTKKMIVK
jgi:hypothetical protein